MLQFFAVFHPLFVVFYITLFITSMYIFKIYFLENENVNFVVSTLCFTSLLIAVWKFPTNLGDGLLAFAGYIALACAPSSFLVLILAKMLAEFLIGAKDFMRLSRRDPIEELEEHIEGLVVAGRFDEAIQILRDKMKLKQNKNEYRLNNEIATISLMYLKDYNTALSEFEEVVKKTDREEPVTFALYRMADIYLTYMDNRKKAIDCLRKIMKQFPNSEYSKSAKIRVEFLEKAAEEEDEDELPTASASWRMGSAAPPPRSGEEAYDMCAQEPHEPYDMSAGPSQDLEPFDMSGEPQGEGDENPPAGRKAHQEVDWRRGALAREKQGEPKKGIFQRRGPQKAQADDDDDF